MTTLQSLTVETPEKLTEALDALKDVVKAKQDAMMQLLPKDKDELLDLIKDHVLEEVPEQIKVRLGGSPTFVLPFTWFACSSGAVVGVARRLGCRLTAPATPRPRSRR